jgi:hypothetical protein
VRGKDLVGLCPFHEDSEPSLVVTPGKNLWHCLGCDAGESVIDWVMRIGSGLPHLCVLVLRVGSRGLRRLSPCSPKTTPVSAL